ncbi:MAG: methyl-accepting chemotaxis protein, partial [Leptospirales bacterium]
FLVWYLGLSSLDKTVDILTSIHVYFYIIIVLLFLSLITRNLILMIEAAKKNPTLVNIGKAQKAVYWLPRLYLYALPVFSFLTPIIFLLGNLDMTNSEFIYSFLLGISFIFINSTPLFSRMLIDLEKWASDIPFSKKYTDLNLGMKMLLTLVPNSIGVVVIMIITLLAMMNQQIVQHVISSSDFFYDVIPKTAIVTVWMLLIVSINLFSLRNQILEPIRNLNDLMVTFLRGGGSIMARMSYDTRDELATISVNYNRIMDVIGNIVKKIISSSNDMENTSEKLNQTSKKYKFLAQKEDEIIDEILKAVDVTNKTTNEISDSTQQQNEDLSDLLEKMKNAATYGDELLEELEVGNTQVVKTSNMAQSGERAMNSMRDSMAKIHQIFQDIAEVLGFINDVAEKINLLSLNASIEAARAGEYGQGFSVVAQQIAKLAEETKKSVADINRLLDVSDEQIKFGSDNITDGAKTILHLMEGVEDIERLFGKLLFALKEELTVFKDIENNLEGVQLKAGTIERTSHIQRDRIRSLLTLVANMNEYSKSGIEATKELSTNANANSQLAESLIKHVTLFRIKSVKLQKDRKSKEKQINPLYKGAKRGDSVKPMPAKAGVKTDAKNEPVKPSTPAPESVNTEKTKPTQKPDA